MPALAPVTINDGAATPVAHNFTPTNVNEGVATWHDRVSGIAIGYPRIATSLKFPSTPKSNGASTSDRVIRANIKVVLPILEVTSPSTGTGIQPAPTKAYDLTFNGEFILPERSSTQNRKDIAALVRNYLATTVVASVVQDLESIY